MNNYKYCPKCGTRNESDAIFCKKCGHKFILNKKKDSNHHNKLTEKLKMDHPIILAFIVWIVISIIINYYAPITGFFLTIIGFLLITIMACWYSIKNGKSHKNISKVIISVALIFSIFVIILIVGSAVHSISSSYENSQRIDQFKHALPNNQWVIHVGHMNMFGEGKVDDNHESHSINNGIIHASNNDNTGDTQYHIDGSYIHLNNFTNIADPNDVATSSNNHGNSPTAKLDTDTTINSAVRSALNDHEKNAVYVFMVKNSDKVIVFTKA